MAQFVAGSSGGTGGEQTFDHPPEGAIVAEVRVNAGEVIDSIEFIYELPGGDLYEAGKHGGMGGAPWPPVHVGRTRWISSIRGLHSPDRCTQVDVYFGGTPTHYVVIGGWHDNSGMVQFEYNAPTGFEIVGFYGRSGAQIDAFGVVFRSLSERRIGGLELPTPVDVAGVG
jgi:hypothetical protein